MDIGNTVETAQYIEIDEVFASILEDGSDHDWFAIEVVEGRTYFVDVELDDPDFNSNPWIIVRDGAGNELARNFFGEDIPFAATFTGTVYLDIGDLFGGANNTPYTLSVSEIVDDFGSTAETAGAAEINGSVTGVFEVASDVDWFAVDVLQGAIYNFEVTVQTAGASVSGMRIQLVNADGNTVAGSGAINRTGTLDYLALQTETLYFVLTDESESSGFTRIDYSLRLDSLINGSAGSDILVGTSENDIIDGLGGDDEIQGLEGADTLNGGDGNDLISGGRQNDTINGGAGNDVILGELGADVLYGGAGNDLVLGGNRNDHLFGEEGNDRTFGGNGNDIVDGGAGIDILRGGSQDDILNGGIGDDIVFGGTGRDTLSGDDGNDLLFGRGGFDILNGGAGDDTLEGGIQADQFIFEGSFGNDTITDFAATNNAERINLSAVDTITDFQDLIDNHMSQIGRDVVIDDGLGNTITLLSVTLSDLDAVDFVF